MKIKYMIGLLFVFANTTFAESRIHDPHMGEIGDELPTFTIETKLTYPFRWDAEVCSDARRKANWDAGTECFKVGLRKAVLLKEITDECKIERNIVKANFAGIFRCQALPLGTQP